MSDHQQLLGAWRLVTWEEQTNRGLGYPLGPDAIGQISYDASGRMSAQLTRSSQAHFVSEDWREAASQERSAAWVNYFGYFGTYSVDEENKAVIHRIEGSWFPNLVGTKQTRYYRFEGKHLVLEGKTPWGNVRIVWEK
jgi:hypothetical protein